MKKLKKKIYQTKAKKKRNKKYMSFFDTNFREINQSIMAEQMNQVENRLFEIFLQVVKNEKQPDDIFSKKSDK